MRAFRSSQLIQVLALLILLENALSTVASTGFQIASSISTPLPDMTIQTPNESAVSSNTTNETATLPEWRKQLPIELHNKTKTLQRIIVPGPNGCRVEVYLLGTAHVSTDSSRDVRMLLDAVSPSVLFLELCDQRIPMLLTPPPQPTINAQEPKKGFWAKFGRKNHRTIPPEESRSMYGMAAGLLTNMQQDYAQSLGVELGGEFRVAYNYWEEHRQQRRIHMILGDRPLFLTLTRAWEGLSLWGKTKLVVSLLISSFQKPNPDELREWMQKILSDDTGDLLTESIAELGKHFPTLEKVIIQERDAYMACKLYQTCRQLLRHQPDSNINNNINMNGEHKVQRLVAIVGAGHIQGMCKLLTQGNGKRPEEIVASLVETKKGILEDDRQILIFDVMEVNPEQLQSMSEQLQGSLS